MPILLRELAASLAAEDGAHAGMLHGSTRFDEGVPLGDVFDDLATLRRTTVQELGPGANTENVHAFFDRAMRDAACEMLARAAEEMDRERTFRDRILGILSHDLKNPLGAITVGIELVLGDPSLRPTARKAAERVASSAGRMLRMIRDLLDLTRVRSPGGLPLKKELVDASDVIADVVEEMRTAHPGRVVELRPPPAPVTGEWDRDRIAQMVSNLLSNAFDHGDPDTPVTVEWHDGAQELAVSVTNRGPAIPELARPHLFEAFQRGEHRRTNHGLGLGLYIVREIAKAQGGDVELERSDGEETRFTIRLRRATS